MIRGTISMFASIMIHVFVIAFIISYSSYMDKDEHGTMRVTLAGDGDAGDAHSIVAEHRGAAAPVPGSEDALPPADVQKEIKEAEMPVAENNLRTEADSGGEANASKEGPAPADGIDGIPYNELYEGDVYIGGFGLNNGPRFERRVMPSYPIFARKMGIEGRVVLYLYINESGELIDIKVVESAGHGFDDSAIKALMMSRFMPATKDGVPVRSRTKLPVRFVLKDL